mmetsp:Transcript_43393/g.114317  ORF Transcript_43393/g.114317 Transcript_43393/m.114317 type:complete len:206 (+) Transcript_43393:370-987(+)
MQHQLDHASLNGVSSSQVGARQRGVRFRSGRVRYSSNIPACRKKLTNFSQSMSDSVSSPFFAQRSFIMMIAALRDPIKSLSAASGVLVSGDKQHKVDNICGSVVNATMNSLRESFPSPLRSTASNHLRRDSLFNRTLSKPTTFVSAAFKVLSLDLQVSRIDDDWEEGVNGDGGNGDDGESKRCEDALVDTREDVGLQENFEFCGI